MTIDAELRARILRHYHADRWRVNTIAAQLGVHHSTVQGVLARAGLPAPEITSRGSIVDPYVPFIVQTLREYPTLTSSTLYAMARERGFRGSQSNFRYRVSMLRPRPVTEPYLRLRTLPGEQAQVDWAHFGVMRVGRAERPLMGFVMVLSFSRALYLRFFLDARTGSFLAGHVGAFAQFNGVPRVILYDNLKSAVLERHGAVIRFNPTLLQFAAHHRFEPRPVGVARGNEKGRVERAIRYVRDAFFAARRYADLDDLNAQARQWCLSTARERPCPQERDITVQAAFEHEQPLLLALPEDTFPIHESVAVSVHKTPYVRFDLNDYSVPHTFVRRELTVLAEVDRIRIVDGAQLVASYARSYERGALIETPEHVAALLEHKRSAQGHGLTESLVRAVPRIRQFLTQAGARGHSIGWTAEALRDLIAQYGIEPVRLAVDEALERGVPHQNAVRFALERMRRAQGRPVPNVVRLPEHLQQRDVLVVPHPLDAYDQLTPKACTIDPIPTDPIPTDHEEHDHGQHDNGDTDGADSAGRNEPGA